MTAETRQRSLLQSKLDRLGFSEDFTPSFNVKYNALGLLDWIEFGATPEHRKDLIWLCNQIARIGQRDKETLECRDNFRASVLVGTSGYSQRYKEAKSNGCCGYFDQLFFNPETGNSYWTGFNYGH